MIKKDAIIIGSGQAGKPLSLKLSYAGWNTIMVEKSESDLGGSCLNVGCTPTKTLIASAKALHTINTAEKHGIKVSTAEVNFQVTQARKDKIVSDSKDGLKERIEKSENLEQDRESPYDVLYRCIVLESIHPNIYNNLGFDHQKLRLLSLIARTIPFDNHTNVFPNASL